MTFSSRLGDRRQAGSLAFHARIRRMRLFAELVGGLGPLSILDVGGYDAFWLRFAPEFADTHRITALNLALPEKMDPRFSYLAGDARCLDAHDHEYDLVFSNSVIEHVGDYEDQSSMARELQRVGRWYFVQTPNYWFPIEPHFLLPGFHWMPVGMRVFLLQRTSLSRFGRRLDLDVAREQSSRIRLLTRSELRRLFPDATLAPERVGPLVKSWMIHNLGPA